MPSRRTARSTRSSCDVRSGAEAIVSALDDRVLKMAFVQRSAFDFPDGGTQLRCMPMTRLAPCRGAWPCPVFESSGMDDRSFGARQRRGRLLAAVLPLPGFRILPDGRSWHRCLAVPGFRILPNGGMQLRAPLRQATSSSPPLFRFRAPTARSSRSVRCVVRVSRCNRPSPLPGSSRALRPSLPRSWRRSARASPRAPVHEFRGAAVNPSICGI